eukprot:333762-Amphidinium_carterae.1
MEPLDVETYPRSQPSSSSGPVIVDSLIATSMVGTLPLVQGGPPILQDCEVVTPNQPSVRGQSCPNDDLGTFPEGT